MSKQWSSASRPKHPRRRQSGRMRGCAGMWEMRMRPDAGLALFGGDNGHATSVLRRGDGCIQPPSPRPQSARAHRPPPLRKGRSAAAFVLIRDWALPAGANGSPAASSLFPVPTVISLGNFDGVHRGHCLLLAEARAIAERHGAWPAVMTPEPHPRTALGGGPRVARLSGLRDKCRLIAGAGVPVIFAPRFTPAFANLSPEAFVEHVLIGAWRACHVVVGEDFRFGRGRRGDVALLHRLLRARAVGLSVLPLLRHRGRPVSSERIRRHLAAGDIEEAAELLGRPWEVAGRIGCLCPAGTADARGWRLHLAPALLRPPPGTYAAIVHMPMRQPTACGATPSAFRDGPWAVTVTISPAGRITVHPRDPAAHGVLRPGQHVVLAWQKACVGTSRQPCDRRAALLPSVIPATRRQMS